MFVPKDMKEKIIFLFCNTRLKVMEIKELTDPENLLTTIEFYEFLSNYRDEQGNELKRNNKVTIPNYKEYIEQLRKSNKKISDKEPVKKDKEKESVTHIKISMKKLEELTYKGKSLEEIKNFYENYGIDIYQDSILDKTENMHIYKIINNNLDDMIYNMRCKGQSYRTISEKLEEAGIVISHETVRKVCKMAFESRNEDEMKTILNSKKSVKIEDYPDDEIYRLRKQKYNYRQITKILKQMGYEISEAIVIKRCKKIFDIYNEKDKTEITYIHLSEDELYKLRKEKGMSYEEMSKYFESLGIKVGARTISRRCKQVFMEKIEDEPSLRRGYKSDVKKIKKQVDLQSMVMEIAKKRKATKLQLEQFAEEVSNMYNTEIKIDTSKENKER